MRTLVLAALLPLAACGNFGSNDDEPGIVGTGNGDTRSYAASDFTKIDLAGSDDVDVRVGAAFSVQATGDTATLDRLRIRHNGDTLEIDRRRSEGLGFGNGRARVTVTMPRIVSAEVSGSGSLAVDRIEGDRFGGSLAGSGKLNLGGVAVQALSLDIAGSGEAAVTGSTRKLEVSIAGSGDVDGNRLTAREASVSIAGSGNLTAAVDGPAKIDMMGSGDVDLGPKARCTVSKMGSGKVRCGG